MPTVRSGLAVSLLVALGCGTGAPAPVRREGSGSEAALFATSPEDFDGIIHASEGLPTVVNAWASWCIPCRAETPLLVKAAHRHEGEVRFLGLNSQDTREEALAFIEEFRVPYPSGFDPTGAVARHLRVLGLPTTLFFLPDGTLSLVHAGEIRQGELSEKLAEISRARRR